MTTLDKIYCEIKALRQEVAMFLPQESLSSYAHPKKIMSAYKQAIVEYPNRLASLHASN